MEFPENTAYGLAVMAGCGSPDSDKSDGADFLRKVESGVQDAISYNPAILTDDEAARDAAWEIADGAPDIYTHGLWSEFVDLQAYQEDPSELGCDGSDLEQCARVALYMIAERLAYALFEEYREPNESADEDEEQEA